MTTESIVCLGCNHPLVVCPSCGDLQCRCKVAWSRWVRQHYDRDGKPYQLSEELKQG